jgi:beta-galactosidase
MEDLSRLTFGEFHTTGKPAFHKGTLQIEGAPADTFLSMRGFHKGFVTVNGINVGRYYTDAGPQYALYIPAPFLREGENEIIVFESEGTETDTLTFRDAPDYTK